MPAITAETVRTCIHGLMVLRPLDEQLVTLDIQLTFLILKPNSSEVRLCVPKLKQLTSEEASMTARCLAPNSVKEGKGLFNA